MKPRVNKNCLSPLLIFVVMFLISLGTASAKDKAEKVIGLTQNTTREDPDTRMPHRNVAKPGLEIKDDDLLEELIKPESAIKKDQPVKEDINISSVTMDEKLKK